MNDAELGKIKSICSLIGYPNEAASLADFIGQRVAAEAARYEAITAQLPPQPRARKAAGDLLSALQAALAAWGQCGSAIQRQIDLQAKGDLAREEYEPWLGHLCVGADRRQEALMLAEALIFGSNGDMATRSAAGEILSKSGMEPQEVQEELDHAEVRVALRKLGAGDDLAVTRILGHLLATVQAYSEADEHRSPRKDSAEREAKQRLVEALVRYLRVMLDLPPRNPNGAYKQVCRVGLKALGRVCGFPPSNVDELVKIALRRTSSGAEGKAVKVAARRSSPLDQT